MSENSGIETVNENLHKERINNTYPEESFCRLFWEKQFKAASLTDARQIKWHPIIIKWCLNFKLISGAAYHAVRASNFIKLPSERTLRDYTNHFENKAGFQDEIDQQLCDEVERLKLSENKKYFGLLIDEMKLKEALVYNKHTGKIIGFTKLTWRCK